MHSFWSLLCLKLLCIKTGTDTQQWSISSASTLKPLNRTERGIYQSTIGRKLLTTRTIPPARPNASCRYHSWTAMQQHCCLLSSHTDKGHRCTSGGRKLLQVMKQTLSASGSLGYRRWAGLKTWIVQRCQVISLQICLPPEQPVL